MKTESKLNVKAPNLWAMLIIYSMPNTVIVAMTPGLLLLGHYFGITGSTQLYYVTTFAILGYGIGPLIAPLIAAGHGRKGTMLAGISLVILGAIGTIVFSVLFTNIDIFLACRLISGIGAGISLTAIPAMISDYYDEFSAKKKLFTITGIYCVWPGIILILCSFLIGYFGWLSSEYFLLMYACLGLLSCFILPETCPVKVKPDNVFKVYIKDCSKLLTNFDFVLYCLLGSLAGILMYYFIAEAPFILISHLHYPEGEYGYIAMLPYIASFFSLMLANIYAKKLTYNISLFMSLGVLLIGSVTMFFMFHTGSINVFSFAILSTIIIMTFSVSMGHSFANALKITPYKVSASGLFLFIMMILSSIIPDIAQTFSSNGYIVFPIVLIILAFAYLGLISIYLVHKRKEKIKFSQYTIPLSAGD